MRQNLERALAARRESRRVEFKETFHAGSMREWCEMVRDVVAMANSGGGVILFGVTRSGQPGGTAPFAASRLDPEQIAAGVHQYTNADFGQLQVVEALRDSQPVVALLVGEAVTPLVFSKAGTYPGASGDQASAFAEGTIYFRHGGKSVPGTTADVAAALDRRVNEIRRSWVSAVKRVVQAPPPAATLPPEIRDSDSPDATPIRVVEDPRAPAYRLIDYDKTHPYRQKELLAAFRQRVPSRPVNQFDLLTVRQMHKIDDRPEFSHRPMFGSRQYSEKFLSWLIEQAEGNASFFEEARRHYAKRMGWIETGTSSP